MGGGGGEEGKSGTETDQQTRTHAVWSFYLTFTQFQIHGPTPSLPLISHCVFLIDSIHHVIQAS